MGHSAHFDRDSLAVIGIDNAFSQAVVGPFYFLYGVLYCTEIENSDSNVFFFFFASRFLEKMFKIIVDSHAVVKSITEISRYSQNTEHFHYHEAPSVALLATLTSLVPGPPL